MTLDWEPNHLIELTSTLSGGGTVTFNASSSAASDETVGNPIDYWLAVCPTATETDPD